MDVDSAAFVLDRVDVAREAIMEAQQIVAKFSQQEDVEVAQLLQELLDRAEHLDAMIRSGSYPS
ncbi:MAG: hypothetical protein ACM3US_05335 [Sphingomonadaceae bacterium]